MKIRVWGTYCGGCWKEVCTPRSARTVSLRPTFVCPPCKAKDNKRQENGDSSLEVGRYYVPLPWETNETDRVDETYVLSGKPSHESSSSAKTAQSTRNEEMRDEKSSHETRNMDDMASFQAIEGNSSTQRPSCKAKKEEADESACTNAQTSRHALSHISGNPSGSFLTTMDRRSSKKRRII